MEICIPRKACCRKLGIQQLNEDFIHVKTEFVIGIKKNRQLKACVAQATTMSKKATLDCA